LARSFSCTSSALSVSAAHTMPEASATSSRSQPHAAALDLHLTAELVGAGEAHLPGVAVAARRHGEDEGATVGGRTPAGVPILIGDGREALVLLGQTAQSGVDGLFLRADEPYLHLARVRESEHLGAQHGRVGDAQQLEVVALAAGDDEEPGPSGDAWMWVAWICR